MKKNKYTCGFAHTHMAGRWYSGWVYLSQYPKKLLRLLQGYSTAFSWETIQEIINLRWRFSPQILGIVDILYYLIFSYTCVKNTQLYFQRHNFVSFLILFLGCDGQLSLCRPYTWVSYEKTLKNLLDVNLENTFWPIPQS